MDVKNITEPDVDGNYSDHDPVLFSLRVATKIERKRAVNKGNNPKYPHTKRTNWDLVDKTKYDILSEHVLDDIEANINPDLDWEVQVKLLLDGLAMAATESTEKPETKPKEVKDTFKVEHKKIKANLKQLKYIKKKLPFDVKNLKADDIVNKIENVNIRIKFLRLLAEKRKSNSIIRKMKAIQLGVSKEKRKQELFSLMMPGKERKFLKKIQQWRGKEADFPSELVIGDKHYRGDDVLKGFADTVYSDSRDPRIENWIPSDQHHCMKTVNRVETIASANSGLMIKPMSKKAFEKALLQIPSNKAPDIFFNSVENYHYANERVKEVIRTICNEMLSDMNKYSCPILSMSTSSFLYKGKGKLRTSPGSYRKLSIGSCINKIIDCYLADTVKLHIRENQSPLQYGFSQNIDFKQCAVLRETSVRLNTLNGKTTFITAADVRDVENR